METVNGYVTAYVREDETVQLFAKYYKFGIAQGNPTTLTNGVTWDSLDSSIATVNSSGLVTGQAKNKTTYINIVYTDSYGNTLLTNTGTRARIDVTTLPVPTISFVNPNAPNNPVTGQDITFTATVGTGTYTWSAPGGSPNSGAGATFVTKYATTGNKTVTVTSGKSASAVVTIMSPVFDISTFQAVPSSGGAPLTSTIYVGTGGNIIGETTKTNYSVWWNCSYTGTNITTAIAQCNSLPTPIPGQCVSGTYGAKCDAMPTTGSNLSISHAFQSGGNYTLKVIAEKASASAQNQIPVTVISADIKANLEDTVAIVGAGESANITWSSVNANSCTASGEWSGAKPINGVASGGVISQPRDYIYTITCTNTATGATDSDSVTVRINGYVSATVSVEPNGSPRPFDPKTGVDLRTIITTNIENQPTNYTAYCDSADASTAVTPDWSRKNDGVTGVVSGQDYNQVDVCGYSEPGTYHPKVIVERGGSAAAARSTVTVEAVPPNQAPSVTPSAPSAPSDYCASPFGWALSWTFSDPLGDSQSAYQVVITDTGTGSVVKDTGEVASASNSYSVPVGTLDFNKTYSWTIKVWDNHPSRLTAQSSGANFTSIKHAAPSLSATLAPARVSKDEVLTITDSSTVYGGATKTAWDWDFSAVTDYTLLTPTNLNEVKVKFTTTGMKNVKLKVTDSDGLWCKKGFNDLPSDSLLDISVGRSVPTNFREISP